MTNMFFLLAPLISTLFHYALGDSCLPDWTFVARLHSCFLVPHYPLPWREAENYCRNEGGHLVSLNNAQEAYFVRALADQHNPQFLTWIGLNRNRSTTMDLPDSWAWSDGSPVTYTNFRAGEPSDWGDCVALSSSLEINGWVTVDCEYSQFYLCEMPANGAAAIIMHDEEGEFQSPGYPNNYPNDVAVNYFIELPADNRIVITIEYMFTEELRDILHIYDGPWEASPTLARLSGFHQNHSFLSHSNVVMAEFSSDGESNGNEIGFKAHYRAWSQLPQEVLHQRDGIISSTNFPLLAPPFTHQHFLIQCADVDHVHFNVTELELSGDDVLVLFEGTTISHRILRKFTSASPHRLPDYIRSEQHLIYIIFEAKDPFELSRWRLRYDCVRKDGVGDEVVIE